MPTICHLGLLFHAQVLGDEEGLFPIPGTLWHWDNWSWERPIVIPMFLILTWYGIGAIRRGRQTGLRKHHFAFFAGWTSLAFALMSPIHRLGDVLFSAHMLQHEILVLIAAPLCAASYPGVTLLYAMLRKIRQPVGAMITKIEHHKLLVIIFSPLSAFLLHAAALWLWHIPSLYQATIDSDFIHALQHLSFFSPPFYFGLLFSEWGAQR